jgi:Flp pilus assembly protein TadG
MQANLKKSFSLQNNDRGAVVVLVAFLVFFLLGIAAFAIDLGYRHVVRNELQNVADAAALAATRELGDIYTKLDATEQQNYICSTEDKTQIKNVAINTGKNNYAGDIKQLAIYDNDKDIQIGVWDSINKTFTPTDTEPNAVKVYTRRQTIDGTVYNGPISTFFAQIFNIQSMGVQAFATASLLPLSTIEEGGLPIPVGISQEWFDPDNWVAEEKGFCDQNIKFYPTGGLDGCAGWNVYQEKTVGAAPASLLKDVMSKLNPLCTDKKSTYYKDNCTELYNPDFKSPAIDTANNDTFTFTGGVAESVLPYFKALYDAKKDSDGNWGVTVPIYKSESCLDNPSGQIEIVGFASAVITGVVLTPSKIIQATVICELTKPGRGGAGNYGTNGDTPSLVE